MWKGLTKERIRTELRVDAEARPIYVLRLIRIDDLIIPQNINTPKLNGSIYVERNQETNFVMLFGINLCRW